MKIIIFGASGSGTTTLGKSLAERLGWVHLDADDYYWAKTDPPFQVKLPLEERSTRLMEDAHKHKSVFISGSLVTWGDEWHKVFDLGIFLRIPPELRLARLRAREKERYGSKWESDEEVRQKSEEFLQWATKYEDESFKGRSIRQHRMWMEKLECEILQLEGDLSHDERMRRALEKISSISHPT